MSYAELCKSSTDKQLDIVEAMAQWLVDTRRWQAIFHLTWPWEMSSSDDVVGPQPLVVLQPADVGRRHEPAAQQSVRVQGGRSLAVGHVGFATRHVLHMSGR